MRDYKVGDKVLTKYGYYDGRGEVVGIITEIDHRGALVSVGKSLPPHSDLSNTDFHLFFPFGYLMPCAPSCPVITETVTRKRIVTGVYGKVKVESVSSSIGILVDDYLDLTELIAASDVFNQLIDAMADSAHP